MLCNTVGTVLSWGILTMVYLTPSDVTKIPVVVLDLEKNTLTWKSSLVIFVSLIICFLFASFSILKPYVGDIGILSLMYIIFMFGTGLLSAVEFNALNWHTLMLLGNILFYLLYWYIYSNII